MALHFADDDPAILEQLEQYGVNRRIKWANKEDIPIMYEDFPEETRV